MRQKDEERFVSPTVKHHKLTSHFASVAFLFYYFLLWKTPSLRCQHNLSLSHLVVIGTTSTDDTTITTNTNIGGKEQSAKYIAPFIKIPRMFSRKKHQQPRKNSTRRFSMIQKENREWHTSSYSSTVWYIYQSSQKNPEIAFKMDVLSTQQ